MSRHRYAVLIVALLLTAALPVLLRSQQTGVARSFKTWSQYLGGADSSQYSALDQINKSNVARLEVAWTYSTGDTRSYRFNPIVVDGTMFVLAKNNSIVALDPVTGAEKWPHRNEGAVTDRGINYWESADRTDRRLLYLNAGSLTAIDARTGNIIASFGDNGRVDVRDGLHRDVSRIRPLQTNNPGRIYQNLMIVSLPAGGAGLSRQPGRHPRLRRPHRQARMGVPHGARAGRVRRRHLAGCRARHGQRRAQLGRAHAWTRRAASSIIPTGTARYDFYGGNRHGANLFANSILALDAQDRQTALALPDRAPRFVGLRSGDRAEAADREARRPRRRRRGAGEQARIPVRVRARFGPSAVADRGAAGSAERRAGRADVADAAVPDAAAAVRAADVHRARHQSVISRRKRRRSSASSCAAS